MNNVMFYSNFEKTFKKIYESDEYNRIGIMCDCIKDKIKQTELYRSSMQQITGYLEYYLRNEKNSFIKMLVIIDSLISHNDMFERILERQNIDTNEFVQMIDKHLLMNRLNRQSEYEENINKVLNSLKKAYHVDGNEFYIYKIYEIHTLKQIELEKNKQKTLN